MRWNLERQALASDREAELAAAAVAALEAFLRCTVPVHRAVEEPENSRWKRAAIAEGVSCASESVGSQWTDPDTRYI